MQSDLDEANKKLKDADSDGYKAKYEKEHKDFEAYKKDVVTKETNAKKATAYKALLKKAGVSEKRMDAVIRLTELDKLELDDKGEIKDADKAVENIKSEWSDYIVKTEEQGAGTENPPSGAGTGGKTLSRAAQVVAKHNEMVYGVKGENSK